MEEKKIPAEKGMDLLKGPASDIANLTKKPKMQEFGKKIKEVIGRLIKGRFARPKNLIKEKGLSNPAKLFKKANLGILFIILLVVLLLGLGVVKIKEVVREGREAVKMAKIQKGEIPAPVEIIPVKVVKVKILEAMKDFMPALGTIKGFKEIDLKFESPGTIEAFNFKEGERVYEGEIVANLDQREVSLKLKYSELDLEKNKKMFEIGAITESKLEQAKLEYESNKVAFDKTNLYAACDGVLGAKDKEEGEYVTQNDKVATLLDISSVFCEFGVIEKDMRKVMTGQKVEVFADAIPDKKFEGVIDEISPMVTGPSRTQTIRVKLENAEEKLKPGMFVRANITVYEKEGVLAIPANALNKKEGAYFVYVIEEEAKPEAAVEEEAPESEGGLAKLTKRLKGKARPKEEAAEETPEETGVRLGVAKIRQVTVGYVKPDLAEITDGLSEGEMVATELHREVPDGAKVQIEEAAELGL